ncbi:hypothetical protein [Fulvivirga sp.]|uniref:hypothetical protein n=1 Tax=Fulvivirga sp. TaxID=1931237 RepID=UPI0032EDFF91
MDIQLEKANLIERLRQVKDESLIKAIKNMLDYSAKKESIDHLLEDSLDRGIEQSNAGSGRAHKEVMKEMREKFKK